MKIEVKRFDKNLPLPGYKTPGAVGFDLSLRNNEKFAPREFRVVPANIAVAVPKGHFLLVNSRGSTAHKFGLMIIPGIVDQDFSGDKDEIHIQALNITDKEVEIASGTRIAQGIFVRIAIAQFEEVDKMRAKRSRGMLGTTGYH
ncbi:MAG: dUTP diphosphatase [Patescibacteria group bacterium]|nr:dUTP diphosphatase [Patescibacteria group bacterium]MCL5432192.1 dUTP diphosphatase [Patescibacteria group bacterium]